jgi:hypothetical protein
VIKRLFFNGVDMCGDHFSIDKSLENPILILADAANTIFPGSDPASMTAQKAGYEIIFLFYIEFCLFYHLFVFKYLNEISIRIL